MLLRLVLPASACQRELRAAIAAHRPGTVRALLARYGERVFANALTRFSRRVIDDALSMLSAPDRVRILNRLSGLARNRRNPYAQPTASFSPL